MSLCLQDFADRQVGNLAQKTSFLGTSPLYCTFSMVEGNQQGPLEAARSRQNWLSLCGRALTCPGEQILQDRLETGS